MGEGEGLWGEGPELGGDAGGVVDLDEERSPAGFDEERLGGPGGDLDARFGVDVDCDEAEGIECLLDGGGGGCGVGVFVGGFEGGDGWIRGGGRRGSPWLR